MQGYKIHKIAEIVHGKLKGNRESVISHLVIDSRSTFPLENTLFIALKGPRHDGHHFIQELKDRGVMHFLISDKMYMDSDVNCILVEDTLTALQKLASQVRKKFKHPVIAITGSNGKTVVKEWLFQCLASKYRVARSPKSYNSQVGVPLSLWLLDTNAGIGIIEAGISFPGEMQKLEKMIKPDIGIFTNIGQAHQENFGSVEEKAEEKLKLFSTCKQLIYCKDHEVIDTLIVARNKSKWQLINWSKEDRDAWLQVISIEIKGETTELKYRVESTTHTMRFPFTGEASLENALHVLTFMHYKEFTTKEIQLCFDHLVPVAMRLELIRGIHNCSVISDVYNNDINSLKIALDQLMMQKQHSGKTVILSDIYQSGLPDEILYRKVAHILSEYNIDRFIGVGKGITRFRQEFKRETAFYETTDKLIFDLSFLKFRNEAILLKGARTFSFERVAALLAEKQHSTLLEINLNHLLHNLNYFRSLLKNTKLMVMVKALAYGSGTYEIANLLQHQKVDYLGVAFTDEGIELRNAGITIPIMVMAPDTDSFEKIIDHELEPEIYNFKTLDFLLKTLRNKQVIHYPVHIKIDSGMHRLGFMEDEIPRLISILKNTNEIEIKAIFTHLAASDDKNQDSFTRKQLDIFSTIYNDLCHNFSIKPMRHVLNSGGIERFPEYHYEMVRLGIGLHGISATGQKLMPVSTLKTHISQIKHLDKGDTVGYNRHGMVSKPTQVGIIPVGYADGLNRKLGNDRGNVIIQGKKAPLFGDICMDMCMVNLNGIHAAEGDEVIIFGEEQPITVLAELLETIPYEIITGVSSRVVRKYIHE